MKFRLFARNIQPIEAVDIESGFAEICNRYESKLRELCIDWEKLTNKWNSLLAGPSETVRNGTHTTLPRHPLQDGFGEVIGSLRSVKKSIKKELKKLSKTLTKEQTKLLKTRTNIWIDEVLGTSELSRGDKFLVQGNMMRTSDRENAEERKLTCKTCGHTPSQRNKQEQSLANIQNLQIKQIHTEMRTQKGDASMAKALKWNMRFGEAALVEMNSRQREQTQPYIPERCPECRFPVFG